MPDETTETTPETTPAPEARGWITQIPKELRDNPAIAKHAKMGDMLQDYIGLASKAERALYLPGKDSPPEEVDAFLKKMGIPKDSSGYELDEKLVKGLPNGKEFVEQVRKTARDSGLTKKQAAKVYEYVAGLYSQGSKAAKEAERQARESFDARLLESVGGDKDKAQAARNRLVAFMTRRVGDKDLVKDMSERGILYDPRYVKLFAALEEGMGDAPYHEGQGRGSSRARSPQGMGSYSPGFEAEFGQRKA